MYLLLHEFGHVLAYTCFALLIFIFKKEYFSARNYFIGLVFTIFIDTDHLIDYYFYVGTEFDISEFLLGGYFEANQSVIVFFHSWEVIMLFFLLFFIQKDKVKYSWILFIALALFAHVIFDVYWYGFDTRAYFLLYRASSGFSVELFR